ncbi:MAPEG family protein [uncultured Sphingomonas sp.]|uniref:MAPEG family protein n=1 Tax=uncultured Sphingomonas sp. TaxID=158754 RepID=UPI0035C95B49
MDRSMLQPVVALIAWSLVMLAWMVVVRLPAMKAAGVDLGKARGGRPGALDGVVPEKAQWPAHNYIHLMEQPTLFYAVVFVIHLTDTGAGLNAMLAWTYVALRIAHSLVQATFNRILVRFVLFALSTVVLIALALHAAIAVF